MQHEKFGRLLRGAINSIANYEAKTAPIIEEELGQQIGVSAASIQRYKAGHLPPEAATIEILAETAIKRGFLNREWLQNFLHAARHPAPEKLLERLCPTTSQARPHSTRVYHNLPAPTYTQFVMREQAYADVVDGLGQRSAAVLIISLGGMGKTSLAREVATHCLQDDSPAPRFEAVVWISDKDRPGATTLALVLDEIARILDYPGFTQFEYAEKLREVEQLLRRQAVLLVIDNFETITDRSLLAWLLRLPEPSKALITTREYRSEFRRGGWPVELHGMSDVEAHELISQRLRMLKIDKLVNAPAQLGPLVAATGGNAKAIEIALGCLKYERQSLPQVVADLHAARGELFDDLFTRCWALLDEAAQVVLLAMPLFPDGASCEALSATAGVQGLAFSRAIERLTDLTLLDTQQADLTSPPRFTLHPLVRAFANGKLSGQAGLEETMRERWLGWYSQLALQVGYCWDNLSRLELLDPEQETVQTVVEWALNNRRYAETLQLTRGVSYYYYIRGFWEKKPAINLMGAEAARNLGNSVAEAEALAYHVQLLSKQGNLREAEKYLPRLRELAQATEFPPDVYFMYQHTFGLFWLVRHDLTAARQAWEESLRLQERLSPHLQIANRQWLATCLSRQNRLQEATALFGEGLNDAVKYDYNEGIVAILIQLAKLDLERKDLASAARYLAESRARIGQHQYRDLVAHLHYLYARLYQLQDDIFAAGAELTEAVDLFERLGMRPELIVAREELARLESQAARQLSLEIS